MLDSGSKMNAINLDYTPKLWPTIWKSNDKVQKINDFILEIFRLVIADFLIEDKVGRPKLLQKFFYIANTKFKAILRIFLLKISYKCLMTVSTKKLG